MLERSRVRYNDLTNSRREAFVLVTKCDRGILFIHSKVSGIMKMKEETSLAQRRASCAKKTLDVIEPLVSEKKNIR